MTTPATADLQYTS